MSMHYKIFITKTLFKQGIKELPQTGKKYLQKKPNQNKTANIILMI